MVYIRQDYICGTCDTEFNNLGSIIHSKSGDVCLSCMELTKEESDENFKKSMEIAGFDINGVKL